MGRHKVTHTLSQGTHVHSHRCKHKYTDIHEQTHQRSHMRQLRVLPTGNRPPLPECPSASASGRCPLSPPAGGRCGWHPLRPSAHWSLPGPRDRKCHGDSILDHSLFLCPTFGPAVLCNGHLLPIWSSKEWPSKTTAKGAAATWTDPLSCVTSVKWLNLSESQCTCLQTWVSNKACFAGLFQE